MTIHSSHETETLVVGHPSLNRAKCRASSTPTTTLWSVAVVAVAAAAVVVVVMDIVVVVTVVDVVVAALMLFPGLIITYTCDGGVPCVYQEKVRAVEVPPAQVSHLIPRILIITTTANPHR